MKHLPPDLPPPLFLPPVSRRADPAESHRGEREINMGQRARDIRATVELIRANPGLTGSELDALTGSAVHGKASKRLTDAEHLGLIRRGTVMRSKVTGKNGATWFVTEASR